jgi:hypothetical protein
MPELERKGCGMKESEALQFQKVIEQICRQGGVWVVVTHESKPDLKAIRIELSVKIDQK